MCVCFVHIPMEISLSPFRVLLEARKATVPCLAERLSEELIAHICVSAGRTL